MRWFSSTSLMRSEIRICAECGTSLDEPETDDTSAYRPLTSEGDSQAEFQIRDIPNGFCFEKKGQRGVNFDWTEWTDTGIYLTGWAELTLDGEWMAD